MMLVHQAKMMLVHQAETKSNGSPRHDLDLGMFQSTGSQNLNIRKPSGVPYTKKSKVKD